MPTYVGPDKPPKYPTTYYTENMIRYQQRTYNVFGPTTKMPQNEATPRC